jgi:phenylacetate-CoA ligase
LKKIDEPTVREFVEEINRFRPRLLLAFPSPLNLVAHTIGRFELELKYQPQWINVSGETFFDCQRANIQSVFHRSRIEDSYGSVELGEIAHEMAPGELEIFSDVAYFETELNEAGQSELVITRLHLTDFPFVRYRMKDLGQVEFRRQSQDRGSWILKNLEGKESNFILAEDGRRVYPSFFNQMVNELNASVDQTIVEIKVREWNQCSLEIQFVMRDSDYEGQLASETIKFLRARLSSRMNYRIQFVDFIDHDYRRKYRVIQRAGDLEFAGGIVGDPAKLATVEAVRAEFHKPVSDDGSFNCAAEQN